MTNAYDFPPRLEGVTEPKRSRCNNSNSLNVETILKDVLTCFS